MEPPVKKIKTSSTPPESKVVSRTVVWEGKWLKMIDVKWVDPTGKDHIWETLERTNHSKAPVDAVEIIPILKQSGKPICIILVRQFRPPPGEYCIELPAGLCDTKEEPAVTALRELKEETGYTGTVVDTSMSMMFGMAVASTTSAVVTVQIDGDQSINQQPRQELDDGEFTEVMVVPISRLMEFLKERLEVGDVIDGKVWLVAFCIQNIKLFT